MNILISLSQKEIIDFILLCLKHDNNYQLDLENNWEMAIKKLQEKYFDILITDFPEEIKTDEINIISATKIFSKTTKILGISLDSSTNTKTKILQEESDACLKYPCTVRELLDTLDKLCFQYRAHVGEPLILGDLVINPASYEVSRAGKKIQLRKKEYQLLEFLMRHPNRVLNRHTILEYIWNYDTQAMTNTLDVHISSLRKKIDGVAAKKLLKTIYGAGYKLSDE